MDLEELAAREGIRDLVARYNLYGDTGRLDEMAALFTEDGVLEYREAGSTEEYAGREDIRDFFTAYASRLLQSDGAATPVFHSVSTHVIDLVDKTRATGRAYVQMLGAAGLEEWGHYKDHYDRGAGDWLFTRRRATTVGRA
jgi:hypothetical protein